MALSFLLPEKKMAEFKRLSLIKTVFVDEGDNNSNDKSIIGMDSMP